MERLLYSKEMARDWGADTPAVTKLPAKRNKT